jgi:pimeloyl-ACP methyl ester carboxylesterase
MIRPLLILALALLSSRLGAAVALETGEIAGAKFTLAVPAHWNHRVLLLAHGLRDANRPLVADLFPDHLAYKALLDEGWLVARTSYRRNGIIVADAIADLDALLAHLTKKFGSPTRVLLEGESMGGLIVTLMAERAPDRYAGAIAIGAALQIKDSDQNLGLSLQPKIPLIFLTNQSELDGPRAYVTAPVPRPESGLRPVLFRVSRDGHVNVSQRERLAALRALNAWLDTGRDSLPAPAAGAPFYDATARPAPQPSQVTLHPDRRGFDARVSEISGNYGNVFLDAQPADFAAIGLGKMQWFQLTVHGQTFRVCHGRDFSSVKRGEWVAFENADGFYWLARNYGDAAATARLQLGDAVTIRRFDDPK